MSDFADAARERQRQRNAPSIKMAAYARLFGIDPTDMTAAQCRTAIANAKKRGVTPKGLSTAGGEDMTKAELIALMPDVAHRLLGAPDKVTRRGGKGEIWRYNDKGGLDIEIDAGGWRVWASEEHGGVIDLIKHELNTDKAGAMRWLESEGLLKRRAAAPTGARTPTPSISNAALPERPSLKSAKKRKPEKREPVMSGKAQRCWSAAHGGRREAAYKWASGGGDKEHAWRRDVTLPPTLRYLKAIDLPHDQRGLYAGGVDGFIVAALAGVDDWRRLYPNAPERVEAIQIIAVGADGGRVDDGGYGNPDERLHKRTLANAAGGASAKVCAVWMPDVKTAGVNVCEGIADALAITAGAFPEARSGITFAAVTNTMANADFAKALAGVKGGVWIYPDHDMHGEGMRRAVDCRSRIRTAGGKAEVVKYSARGGKDAYDAAMGWAELEAERQCILAERELNERCK